MCDIYVSMEKTKSVDENYVICNGNKIRLDDISN